jgi:hypothetical protein
MASLAVDSAVRARITANWTHARLFEPNVDLEVPDDLSPYLVVEFPVGTEEQASLGAPGQNVFREEGGFVCTLAIVTGTSLADARGWMEELRALFRDQVFDGVTTWSADPIVDDGKTDDGAYYELSFAVPYRYDIFA